MSIEPVACPGLSKCPPGSSAATAVANGVAITSCIVVILILIFTALVFIQRRTTHTLSSNLEKRLQEFNVINALLRTISGSSKMNHTLKGFHAKKNRVTIGFSNLGLRLKGGKKVLDGVSGEFRSSTLVRCEKYR